MPVRVDQARHDNPPSAVDHVRVVWRGRVSLGHGLDPTALDEQAEAIAQCVRLAVEQTEIREQNRPRRRGGRRLRAGVSGQSERCDRGAHASDKAAPGKIRADPTCQGLNFRPVAQAAGVTGESCRISRCAGEHGHLQWLSTGWPADDGPDLRFRRTANGRRSTAADRLLSRRYRTRPESGPDRPATKRLTAGLKDDTG